MKLLTLISTASILGLSAPASAAIIVDTGPSGAPNNNGGYFGFANGGSSINPFELAASFTLASSYVITSVEFFGAGIGPLNASIRADGPTPGAVLYSTSFNPYSSANGERVFTGPTSLKWALGPGTYFVGFESPDSASALAVQTGFQHPSDREFLLQNGSWAPLASTFSDPRFQSVGIRIQGDQIAAAVPELATWAMMIGGIGMLGGALRRRRDGAVDVRVSYA